MSDDLLERYARSHHPSPQRVARLVDKLDRARHAPALARPARSRGLWGGAVMLAAAAALILVLRPGVQPETAHSTGLRGVAAVAGAPEGQAGVRLRLAVERSGAVVALQRGDVATVGERIYFRVSTTGPARVALWLEGPSGRVQVGEQLVDAAQSIDLQRGSELLVWRFDEPGLYQFWASSAPDGACIPTSCGQQAIEVR
jgi:hypothetical protein